VGVPRGPLGKIKVEVVEAEAVGVVDIDDLQARDVAGVGEVDHDGRAVVALPGSVLRTLRDSSPEARERPTSTRRCPPPSSRANAALIAERGVGSLVGARTELRKAVGRGDGDATCAWTSERCVVLSARRAQSAHFDCGLGA
jgi:hypothetical protein